MNNAHLSVSRTSSVSDFFGTTDTSPTLRDLEDRVAATIKAKNDFLRSCWPSSLSRCCAWLQVGGMYTAGLALTGAAGWLAYGLGGHIGEVHIRDRQVLGELPIELAIGAGAEAVLLFYAMASHSEGNLLRARIAHEDVCTLEQLERNIHAACAYLATEASKLPLVDFENFLQQCEVPLSGLVDAHRFDAAKTSALAERLLAKGEMEPLVRLAKHDLAQCRIVADLLLNALLEPSERLSLLEDHPDHAAELLAVLCMAGNAMLHKAPDKLQVYLETHAEVALKAWELLRELCESLDLHQLASQLEQGRVAGIVMSIAVHGATNWQTV
jgi:hypothetical protein